MKIDEAISGRDFRQAKQLALTPEHWRKIKEAEESGAIPIKESSVALHEQPQLQQQEMQGQRQVQQQQESQRLGQELNAYMQSPSVARAIQGAGTSGASMQNLLINNKINQLNQTAKGGASIQRR